MDQKSFEEFILELPNVQSMDSFGYIFYFVGDDHRLPFATIGYEDNEFDQVSNLNREGIFRLNIGISNNSYKNLVDQLPEQSDYTTINEFLPHPHYSRQNYICILNPYGDNIEQTKKLILEAHNKASLRVRPQ
ncbi:DUF6194 family protein [Halobacillus sp. B29]|uniref:DUF6194 family protein n=1 Tax=Halobacillus sp. B29 TaxID=3457432 RepID=UPI003FCC41C2